MTYGLLLLALGVALVALGVSLLRFAWITVFPHEVFADTPPAEPPVRVMCAWCRRVKGDDGLFANPFCTPDTRYTHGICPECQFKQIAELETIKSVRH